MLSLQVPGTPPGHPAHTVHHLPAHHQEHTPTAPTLPWHPPPPRSSPCGTLEFMSFMRLDVTMMTSSLPGQMSLMHMYTMRRRCGSCTPMIKREGKQQVSHEGHEVKRQGAAMGAAPLQHHGGTEQNRWSFPCSTWGP